jgi:hypothetical protein
LTIRHIATRHELDDDQATMALLTFPVQVDKPRILDKHGANPDPNNILVEAAL